MSKRSFRKNKRRSKTLPALGLAGVSFSLASGACASTSEASANTPPTSQSQMSNIFLGEEEIFDVSLATFYVYDKENGGRPSLDQRLRLARGGCGGCGGCHGCGGGGGCHGCGGGGGCHIGGGGGGCHIGCGGGGCRCGGGIHIGCGGGCHFGCRGCRCGGFFFGGCLGCGGCGGCTASCWVWTPSFGWIYSCSARSTPAGEESSVVARQQSGRNTEAAPKGDRKIAGARTKSDAG
jgi:hypothetical protein